MNPSFSMEAGAVELGEGIRRAQAIKKSRSYGNGTNAITHETIEEARHAEKPSRTSAGSEALSHASIRDKQSCILLDL
jgi:hypothetical protein